MSQATQTNPYTFLVGSARSGTTLLKRIVDAHPEICVSPETHWVPRFFLERTGITDEGYVTRELVTKLASYWRFPRFRVSEEDLGKLLADDQSISFASFVSGFYDLIGKAKAKPLVGDKTGSYARHLPLLHGLWPDARFVHLIRDGRDVALSVLNWKSNPGASRFPTWQEDPVMTTALWWSRNVRLGREAGSTLSKGLYHEVGYERLVAGPEDQCRTLCAFLGLAYDDAMLRFHEGKTKDEPGLDAKHAWLPITPNLRNWREQMPSEEIERFEAAAGDLLDELGYERSFPQPREEFASRAHRFRNRLAAELQARQRPVPSGWNREPQPAETHQG